MAREELLTLAQLLAELGEDDDHPLPKSTFYDWIAKGRAPRGIRLPNGSRRWRRREVTRWLNELEDAR
jgi:predicted DNA-binding transcriptional regulator AlpA